MAVNDITGDNIASRFGSKEAKEKYESNFDLIFRKKDKQEQRPTVTESENHGRENRNES